MVWFGFLTYAMEVEFKTVMKVKIKRSLRELLPQSLAYELRGPLSSQRPQPLTSARHSVTHGHPRYLPNPRLGHINRDHILFSTYKLSLLPSAKNPVEVMRFQAENNSTLSGFSPSTWWVGDEASVTT